MVYTHVTSRRDTGNMVNVGESSQMEAVFQGTETLIIDPDMTGVFWEGLMQLGDHAIVYGVTWGYVLQMGMIRYSTAQVRPIDPIFRPRKQQIERALV